MDTPRPPKIPESVLVVIHTAELEVLLIERADRPSSLPRNRKTQKYLAGTRASRVTKEEQNHEQELGRPKDPGQAHGRLRREEDHEKDDERGNEERSTGEADQFEAEGCGPQPETLRGNESEDVPPRCPVG